MDKYSLAFSVSNLGPKTFQKILNKFGSSEKGWNSTEEELSEIGIKLLTYKKFNDFRKSFDLENYLLKLKKNSISFIPFGSKYYPKGLNDLPDPPIGIYVLGNILLLKNTFCLGVVGTRKITQYGKDVTEILIKGLVESNVCIVSGLALGIDAYAHRVTIENGGVTIAVLACGVDCCLPSENYNLYKKILNTKSLILSEYPLSQNPNKGTFLARNRIIAAISSGVLVTEAASNSGSLVTADWAQVLGKKVFAVPGPITSRMSDGGLFLLKKGATLVTNTNDILDEFSLKDLKSRKLKRKYHNLDNSEKKIIGLLHTEALSLDEMLRILKKTPQELIILISGLELKGIVESSKGEIRLKV